MVKLSLLKTRIIMAVVLEVQDVKKSYRMGKVAVPALRGVSFQVKTGEFLTIFGPSGSGKSTLLHLMGALDRPDSGKILMDSVNILELNESDLADLRLKRIGFVFQFFNLLPRLTTLRNIQLPLDIAGLPEKESREKAQEMIVLVGLQTRENHRLPSKKSF